MSRWLKRLIRRWLGIDDAFEAIEALQEAMDRNAQKEAGRWRDVYADLRLEKRIREDADYELERTHRRRFGA